MLGTFEHLLSKTPLWTLTRDMRDPFVLAAWNRKGRPLPPPSGYKRRVIREYARQFHCKTMVETGTLHGEMGFAMKGIFSRFVTIELSPVLHAAAIRRLAPFPNIECLQGDSAIVLPSLLSQIQEPCLFWLDAHYSGSLTAKGDVETPISVELNAILSHRIRNHVVLIDDARCFDGTHDYPLLSVLRDATLALRPDLSFKVEFDIIRITP